MAREHEAAVLPVHAEEFLAPHLEDSAGVGDRVRRPVDVTEERRVVHDPLDGDLGQRPVGGRHVVGHVVPHQRAVVPEPVSFQERRGPHVHVPGRRPIARGLHAELIRENPELLHHHRLFLRLVQRAHGLVDVAVSADLVPRVADTLALRQMVDDGPPGDEEARPQSESVEHSQDAIDADAGAEAALLEVGEAPLGLLGLAEEEARLGVEVEGQHRGGLFFVRPHVAHRWDPHFSGERAQRIVRIAIVSSRLRVLPASTLCPSASGVSGERLGGAAPAGPKRGLLDAVGRST